MGNCSFKTEKEEESVKKASKEDYTLNYVIGRGGFGKVWKVEDKKSGVKFALKEMMKARVIAKRSIASVMNEKQFLSQLYHPFLVNMKQAF
jgi:serum/glucocorticoid-regulated kinase 2